MLPPPYRYWVREAFLSFFVSLLKDFHRYFLVVRVNPDPSVVFDRAAFFHAKEAVDAGPKFRARQARRDAVRGNPGESNSRCALSGAWGIACLGLWPRSPPLGRNGCDGCAKRIVRWCAVHVAQFSPQLRPQPSNVFPLTPTEGLASF